jgi:hypothetical protein
MRYKYWIIAGRDSWSDTGDFHIVLRCLNDG